MIKANLVALSWAVLLACPASGVSQAAPSGPGATAGVPGIGLVRVAGADTGSVTPREPRDRTARLVIGTYSGALLGASAGSIYGNRNYEPCRPDCHWDRGYEVFLFAILGGIGGSVLGGLAGWFWPSGPAQGIGVGLDPAGRDGVAVSLSVRH